MFICLFVYLVYAGKTSVSVRAVNSLNVLGVPRRLGLVGFVRPELIASLIFCLTLCITPEKDAIYLSPFPPTLRSFLPSSSIENPTIVVPSATDDNKSNGSEPGKPSLMDVFNFSSDSIYVL